MNKIEVSKNSIILTLILLFGFISIFIYPSFARLLTNDNSNDYWDGVTVSRRLDGSGTASSPYLIKSGADFAFFIQKVNESSSYASANYKFINDIYLNEGAFDFSDTLFKYYRDNNTYYIEDGIYYSDSELNSEVGTINTVNSINSFSGIIDGDGYTLHGLYIDNDDDAYLFNNFSGSLIDLKIDNTYIDGSGNVGFINNSNNGTITGVSFNGVLKNNSSIKNMNGRVADSASSTRLTLTLTAASVPVYSSIDRYELTGDSEISFTYDNNSYNSGDFNFVFNEHINSVVLIGSSNWRYILNLFPRYGNLEYTTYYYDDITGFIVMDNGSTILNSVMKGDILAYNVVGSFIGVSENSATISNSYSLMNISSNYTAGGLIGYVNNSTLNVDHAYNNGNITSENIASGVVGVINNSSKAVNFSSVFNYSNVEGNSSTGGIIGSYTCSTGTFNNVYYTETVSSGVGNTNVANILQVNSSTLNTRDYLINTMLFEEYGSSTISNTSVWIIQDGILPYFYFDDQTSPFIKIIYNNNEWTSEQSLHDIRELEVDRMGTIIIQVNDSDSDILKIEYFVNKINSIDRIAYDEISWQLYTSDISIEKNGFYTVYVKAIDTSGNVSYASTDLIVLDSYTSVYSEGVVNRDITEYSKFASNSVINISYNHNVFAELYPYPANSKSLIESTSSLPSGTIIYLYDRISNDTYRYNVDSTYFLKINNKYYYDLGKFVSISDSSKKYNNIINNYYSDYEVNENFELSFDFSSADIDNYVFKSSIVIMDNGNIECRTSTLIREFDIYDYNSDTKYDLNFDTNYSDVLDLSNVGDLDVSFTISDSLNILNDNIIYDPDFFIKKYKMKIGIIDQDGNKVDGKFINNLSYLVNDTEFFPRKDNMVYIPLDNLTDTLKVKVNNNYNDILSGSYYLKITVYNNYNSNNFVVKTIPLAITNGIVFDYNFSVSMNNTDRIIIKSMEKTQAGNDDISFKCNYNGNFNNPNIKVKLSWRDNFTTGSSFSPVNIVDYFSDDLVSYSDNWFDLIDLENNEYSLSFTPDYSKFSYGTYKISFGLFDEDTLVTEEEFNIIIK